MQTLVLSVPHAAVAVASLYARQGSPQGRSKQALACHCVLGTPQILRLGEFSASHACMRVSLELLLLDERASSSKSHLAGSTKLHSQQSKLHLSSGPGIEDG